MTQYDHLLASLKSHEGSKLKPYRDNSKKLGFENKPGKLSIGIGRNLDDVGLSNSEEEFLCRNDINRSTVSLIGHLEWVKTLDEVRAATLIEMTFNEGITSLEKFAQTLMFTRTGAYDMAAAAMLNSLWAKQVGERADHLALQMKTGVYWI